MCVENTKAPLSESCGRSIHPEPAGDTLDQQGEPVQAQADESQSCCSGEEDARTEPNLLSVDGKNADDETDLDTAVGHIGDNERIMRANTEENQQNIQDGSEVTLPVEKEEPNRADADPDDQSERTASITSLSSVRQAAAGGGMSDSEKARGVCDQHCKDMDHDNLSIPEELHQKTEGEKEVKDEEDVATKKAAYEDHKEHFFSADPAVDSLITLRQCPERLSSINRGKQTQKQEAQTHKQVLQLCSHPPALRR